MAIAIVVVALVIGSLLFHFASPWWFTPIASNWGTVDDTVKLTFVVTGIVFVLVNLFMAFCVLKYRHKPGRKAHYEPESKRLELWLTVITSVGVAAMLAPGLLVWARFVEVPDDAHEVEVVGRQWNWIYRYPGADGVLGQVDPLLISVDNPFGMDPDDPQGRDDVLVQSAEMHLPVNKPVKVLLRSKDVLHNFTVSEFRVKMDLVPGTATYLWLTPTRTGEFDVLCEELCGMAHHTMRGRVIVDTDQEFRGWLAGQPTYAQMLATQGADVDAGKLAYTPCAACHGQAGEGNVALNAPKLAGLDSDYLRRQLQNYKAGVRGSVPDDVFGAQMRGMAATLASDAAISNVVGYISTFADVPAVPTLAGDVRRGEKLYATCINCHGNAGQGIWAMNAPRIAGMNDWYIARQLRDFRDGVRGIHRQDFPGRQMAQFAQMLNEDQEILDTVAFLNQLDTARLAQSVGMESSSQARLLD